MNNKEYEELTWKLAKHTLRDLIDQMQIRIEGLVAGGSKLREERDEARKIARNLGGALAFTTAIHDPIMLEKALSYPEDIEDRS